MCTAIHCIAPVSILLILLRSLLNSFSNICLGDEVIYLDPHTTQQTCFVEGKDNECERQADQTYHCQHASRLPILNMDPSLAVVSDNFLIRLPDFQALYVM